MNDSLDSRVRKLERRSGRPPEETLEIAGARMTRGELEAVLSHIDGKTRGIPKDWRQ